MKVRNKRQFEVSRTGLLRTRIKSENNEKKKTRKYFFRHDWLRYWRIDEQKSRDDKKNELKIIVQEKVKNRINLMEF